MWRKFQQCAALMARSGMNFSLTAAIAWD